MQGGDGGQVRRKTEPGHGDTSRWSRGHDKMARIGPLPPKQRKALRTPVWPQIEILANSCVRKYKKKTCKKKQIVPGNQGLLR